MPSSARYEAMILFLEKVVLAIPRDKTESKAQIDTVNIVMAMSDSTKVNPLF